MDMFPANLLNKKTLKHTHTHTHTQNLAAVMQPSRDAMEWPLSQMDQEVEISFNNDFNFALAGLLYKGFSHPLSTVRTRTQELLTTLFFIHSPTERCAPPTLLFPPSPSLPNFTVLVLSPDPTLSRGETVKQVKFLGLAHTFVTM